MASTAMLKDGKGCHAAMQIGSSERGGKRLGGSLPVRAGHLG
jgi:hypothetical protein